jgi:hypothetical protein
MVARPGDHVRMTFDVAYRAPDGAELFRKTWVLEGELVDVGPDSLVLGWEGHVISYDLGSIKYVEKRCHFRHAVINSARRGATVTGIVFGLLTGLVAYCNPEILGDGSCGFDASSSDVAAAGLIGAGVGAAVGGLLGAGVGSLTRERWQTVSLQGKPPSADPPRR